MNPIYEVDTYLSVNLSYILSIQRCKRKHYNYILLSIEIVYKDGVKHIYDNKAYDQELERREGLVYTGEKYVKRVDKNISKLIKAWKKYNEPQLITSELRT